MTYNIRDRAVSRVCWVRLSLLNRIFLVKPRTINSKNACRCNSRDSFLYLLFLCFRFLTTWSGFARVFLSALYNFMCSLSIVNEKNSQYLQKITLYWCVRNDLLLCFYDVCLLNLGWSCDRIYIQKSISIGI